MSKLPLHFVSQQLRDGVSTLTINRPAARNAMNWALVEQLKYTFRAATQDAAINGIVFAAVGNTFLTGVDIEFFARNLERGDLNRIVNFTRAAQELFNEIAACPKPVIAQVQGAAFGGGLELTLACDRIVAAPAACFAYPETGLGIYPGLGGTQRTPRRIGIGLAKWLIYTGKILSAVQARDIGLIDEVVSSNELPDAAHRLILNGFSPKDSSVQSIPARFESLQALFSSLTVEALRQREPTFNDDPQTTHAIRTLHTKSQTALHRAEQLIDEGNRMSLSEGLQLELDYAREIFSTSDAQNGLRKAAHKQTNTSPR